MKSGGQVYEVKSWSQRVKWKIGHVSSGELGPTKAEEVFGKNFW
jgi:hypothetical protein